MMTPRVQLRVGSHAKAAGLLPVLRDSGSLIDAVQAPALRDAFELVNAVIL